MRNELQAEKQAIVDEHNSLRSKVALGNELRSFNASGSQPQPPASNMRKLVWDDDLAITAQV